MGWAAPAAGSGPRASAARPCRRGGRPRWLSAQPWCRAALWSRVDGVDGAGARVGSPKRYSADAVEGKRPGAVAARWLASNDKSRARRIAVWTPPDRLIASSPYFFCLLVSYYASSRMLSSTCSTSSETEATSYAGFLLLGCSPDSTQRLLALHREQHHKRAGCGPHGKLP